MDWVTCAEQGHRIIAGSERLARDLRVRFNRQMRAEDRRGWLAPDIVSMRSFVLGLWEQSWPDTQLLNGAQELAIWLDVIQASDTGGQLISPGPAARSARTAARLVMRHGGGPESCGRPLPTDDEQAFNAWFAEVVRRVDEGGFVLEEQVAIRVRTAIREPAWELPVPTMLLGFERVSGVTRDIVNALVEKGAKEHVEAPRLPVNAQRVDVATPGRQYEWVASAIRDQLERARASGGEAPSIAVLVDDVREAMPRLEATLRDRVSPQGQICGQHQGRFPWRYARGGSLMEHPLIEAALDCLALESGPCRTEDASRVLLSPNLFHDVSARHRAEADLRLRNRAGSVCGLARLVDIQRPLAECHNPLPGRLEAWHISAQQGGSSAMPSEWVERWLSSLALAGWRGTAAEQECDQALQQVLGRWDEALDAFRAMDRQLQAVSRGGALQWLREVLSDLPTQLSPEHEQPVQILSFADADSLRFDRVYVCNANAHVLPPPATSSGFVSAEILEAIGVPDATPDGALLSWRHWVGLLGAMAPDITLVVPAATDDGAELFSSPLFLDWEFAAPCGAEVGPGPLAMMAGRESIEAPGYEPDLPPVVNAKAEGIRGGTGIITRMAEMPFLAFARYRLGLSEFPAVKDGLDARDQGIALHRALQLIWSTLKTQEALQALATTEIESMAQRTAEKVCMECLPAKVYGQGLVDAEVSRLALLLVEWLELEARREHPFEVVATELKASVNLEGIETDVVVDRVDRIIVNGESRFMILDYKSSSSLKVTDWDAQSMAEPQLPIYAAFIDWPAHGVPRIDGIGFARVRRGGCGFLVLSNFVSRLIPGARDGTGDGVAHWGAIVDEWRLAIAKLAGRFMKGDIEVVRSAMQANSFSKDLYPLLRAAPPISLQNEEPVF
ncbi:PD-(D/E)XK nuclease family protein (plasmid) [Flagellatimonas centrodinii]|uniref:PD-(D/E)XK nuclease family protein n=1 Tax=Flagellatimonas centrodinii TaxID=2806210 RepID=UPI001FF99CA0|nr:PD-(D/E)XK nuclease family protein [Flagellatimonas centrodinii]ULQ48455.1 PD-(D/E)XK nuclease family protein [Flagellatimonas centrodinii]